MIRRICIEYWLQSKSNVRGYRTFCGNIGVIITYLILKNDSYIAYKMSYTAFYPRSRGDLRVVTEPQLPASCSVDC